MQCLTGTIRASWMVILCVLSIVSRVPAQRASTDNISYDLVLLHGRVIDPESGLDAVRNVGVANGSIQIVTTEQLRGRTVIDAQGLVVAPGFIDLHAHGQDLENNCLQVRDGVTTALELEAGPVDVDAWYAEREGKRLINTGTSVGMRAVRQAVIKDKGTGLETDRSSRGEATATELASILSLVDRGLQRGALDVGWLLNEAPGSTQRELIEVFRTARKHGALVDLDIRFVGTMQPDTALLSLLEAVGASASTGAALQLCHICSNTLQHTGVALDIIAGARARGMDVMSECHPYTVAMGDIRDATFDPGFDKALGITYHDLEWVETKERLTPETFEKYRRVGGPVLVHMIPEDVVRTGLSSPIVAVISDGGLQGGKGHPRSAGSFARVLGRYVREQKVLSLTEALRKMTIMPAQRLESRVPMMKKKGRIRVGADADITVFNPDRIIDRATYENPSLVSQGISYVLVNGVVVVSNGQLRENVLPGRAIRAPIDNRH